VLVAVQAAAFAAVVLSPTASSNPVATVEHAWGRCLDMLGVTTAGARVERVSVTESSDRTVRVTMSDGGSWLVRGDRVVSAGAIAAGDVAACRASGVVR
jgi:hypothetical protein